MIANTMPKTEINLRRLLSQCEKLVKDDTQINWRVEKVLLILYYIDIYAGKLKLGTEIEFININVYI